jgi:hypothetical protein
LLQLCPKLLQAVDVYLGFCYLQTNLALIEYAVVAFTLRTRKKHDEKLKQVLNKPDPLDSQQPPPCTCSIPGPPCIRHSRVDVISRALFPTMASESPLFIFFFFSFYSSTFYTGHHY